ADGDAALAAITPGLVLVPVMNHEIHPIAVTGQQFQIRDVPARLSPIALILRARGRGLARAKIPMILRRVRIERHRYRRRGFRPIDRSHTSLPGPKDGVRGYGRAAPLPISRSGG